MVPAIASLSINTRYMLPIFTKTKKSTQKNQQLPSRLEFSSTTCLNAPIFDSAINWFFFVLRYLIPCFAFLLAHHGTWAAHGMSVSMNDGESDRV